MTTVPLQLVRNGLPFHIFNADVTQADTFFLHQKEKNVPRPSRRPHFTDALRRRCTTPTFSVSRAKATLTDMLLYLIILYDYTTKLLQMQPLIFTIFRPFIRQKMSLPFRRELPRSRLRLFRSKPRPFPQQGRSPHFHLYKCWGVSSSQNRRQHYPSNPWWIQQ